MERLEEVIATADVMGVLFAEEEVKARVTG